MFVSKAGFTVMYLQKNTFLKKLSNYKNIGTIVRILKIFNFVQGKSDSTKFDTVCAL